MEKLESFKSFEISKLGMNEINGQRSKEFIRRPNGDCAKFIDYAGYSKFKVKDRYEGKCD
ncbi:hypothetical protein [Tenacibaculum sp. Ill]|uniref:hypothetical protein n=1 Tax=Tenacibaculum sp. Ill TaxID=3445935 RepID=UPI003F7A52C4